MHNHKALLIEDEGQQARRVTQVLTNAGFEVADVYADAAAARSGCADRLDLIDLVVIDRRLPEMPRLEPLDSVGDELLEFIVHQFRDSLIVVFTGYGDAANAELATAERGNIALDADHSFDRVRHFQKTDYRGFEAYVQRVSAAISALNAIDIDEPSGTNTDDVVTRRLLRKLAVLDGGQAVRVVPLEGGLTRRSVYRATVIDSQGSVRSRRVVKIGPRRYRPPYGGFATLLDGSFVAAPVEVITGLCAGKQAQVLQIAGENTASLFSVLSADPAAAATCLRPLIEVISRLPTVQRTIPVEELFVFGDAQSVASICGKLDLPLVTPGLQVLARIGSQHGDLHAGNILMASGHPILIDFDSCMTSSIVVDPLTLLLSSMFHVNSPLRDRISISPAEPVNLFQPGLLADNPAIDWFAMVIAWLDGSRSSSRELAALTLSYIARQITFPEFPQSGEIYNLASRLATDAAHQLAQV